ncbi:hypothetical protein V6B95_11340, partial [Thermoanaerobacterium saccharolyticum]
KSSSSASDFDIRFKNRLKVDVDGTGPNTLKPQLYLNTGSDFSLSTSFAIVGIFSSCIAIKA